eukprot:COSAG01_NODE_74073_length_229_cov_2.707692_1_plen_30_part_10
MSNLVKEINAIIVLSLRETAVVENYHGGNS